MSFIMLYSFKYPAGFIACFCPAKSVNSNGFGVRQILLTYLLNNKTAKGLPDPISDCILLDASTSSGRGHIH
jgi:hypothetical protein